MIRVDLSSAALLDAARSQDYAAAASLHRLLAERAARARISILGWTELPVRMKKASSRPCRPRPPR